MDELIEKDQTDLFNENDFNRIKKAVIGDYILGSDSLNHLVVNRAYYVDDDLTRDDFFKMQKAMTFKDVLEAFKIFQTKAIYTSVVLSPNKVE
jgi:predicted Zn-dependent peptidase